MEIKALLQLSFLLSAVLFILGLKDMTRAKTAVRGNVLGAIGMFVAILASLYGLHDYIWIFVMLAIGSVIGAIAAQKVQMTAMPQMVGLFNGFGGLASLLVAVGDSLQHPTSAADVLWATAMSAIIGAVTFSGSIIAAGKLQEMSLFKKPSALPMQQWINALIAILLLGCCFAFTISGVEDSQARWWLLPMVTLALFLGIFLVNPIGGADMPVVIALLNSYSGLAAAATGFVIDNHGLIISGSLVGASGVILTNLMCKAMNRSLFNVLFGVMDAGASSKSADDVYANVRSTTSEDVAMILDGAQRVVVVPGYGMAVAQAQHAVKRLAQTLEQRGTKVEYAIHPVAGRMPGHMNVLLAEADVPYDQLIEMENINPTMDTVDVAIVIGANDVVNPLARTDPKSPIAGMPIIDVDKARTVIVIKRSLSPGFAGIPNPLFALDNTLMLYADGQKAVLDIVSAMKENA